MMRKKLLILLLAAMLVLTFAACGNGNDDTQEPNGEENGASSAIEDFLTAYGESIRSMMEAMTPSMGTGGYIELVAGTGNELIYRFVYGSDFEVDDTLVDTLRAMGPFFRTLADSFRDEMELPYMRITVRYYDYDGNLIAEESFDSVE